MKWSGKDTKRLENAIRNFNRNITRKQNTVRNARVYLPNKKEYSEVRQELKGKSRAEVNSYIKGLQRANQKTLDRVITKGGEISTKYQLNELVIKKRALSTRYTNETKRILNKAGNKKKQKMKAQARIKQLKQDVVIPTKKINELGHNELNRLMRIIQNTGKDLSHLQKMDAVYKKNYLGILRDELHIDPESEFYKKLENLSESDFAVSYMLDPELDITVPYRQDEEHNVVEQLESHWNKFIEDYVS